MSKKNLEIHNKLVRDLIPERCDHNGDVAVTKVLDDKEFEAELKTKLQEEIKEYIQDDDPAELADLLEIIYTLAARKNVSIEQLEQIRKEKSEKRGSFSKKIYLIETYKKTEE